MEQLKSSWTGIRERSQNPKSVQILDGKFSAAFDCAFAVNTVETSLPKQSRYRVFPWELYRAYPDKTPNRDAAHNRDSAHVFHSACNLEILKRKRWFFLKGQLCLPALVVSLKQVPEEKWYKALSTANHRLG